MATVLGLAGGPNVLGARPAICGLSGLFFHDAAAALVRDGQVLFATEEERISRIKHSNDFPTGAIRACLKETGITATEIDSFAFFFEEEFCNSEFRRAAASLRIEAPPDARELIASNLEVVLGSPIDRGKIRFVPHHDAHCRAAHAASNSRSSLIFVIDGMGERESISVYVAEDGNCEKVDSHPPACSLGFFYNMVTRLLGFGDFDEYKVMGLAPYGNSNRYQHAFNSLYVRNGDGISFTLDSTQLPELCWRLGVPSRRRGGPLVQEHMDFAAAAQRLLENVCLDLLRRWQQRTGLRHLCLAGGVAQNCVMNGVIAQSGLFDQIYVHPASHDAGSAIGAALLAENSRAVSGPAFCSRIGHRIDTDGNGVEEALARWHKVLQWDRPKNMYSVVATTLAEGHIIGWARGRAEFGPRALGSRSILADPRPRENWQRINRVIKKREDFRPFAPAVLEEVAGRYFDLPNARCNFGEMCFAVPVREEWREMLGAVTHVDGSARIQIVSRIANPDFWSAISAFESLTNVGLVLNTSFNNSHEPIVDCARDAVRTFLTTDLDYLAVGPYWVSKQKPPATALLSARVSRLAGAKLTRIYEDDGETHTLTRGCNSVRVSKGMADWLSCPGDSLPADILEPDSEFLDELLRLWESRVIDVEPAV